MKRFFRVFVYVSLFILISSVSNNDEISSSTYKIVDGHGTNYTQKRTPVERTMDFLLAHHFFDISHAIDDQSTNNLYKSKDLFSYISSNPSRNIKINCRLFTIKVVDNLFLFKDSHYIFKLRKIII